VGPDCTGKLFSNGQETGRLVLADRGTRLFLLSEAPEDAGVLEIQESVGEDQCTNGSLKGSYGFARTGMTGDGPLSAVGIATSDGAGNFVATQTINRNGDLNPDATGEFIYQLNGDCTGILFFDGGETGRLIAVANGNGILLLSENEGNTLTGIERRISW
jgi:hypothetical protein